MSRFYRLVGRQPMSKSQMQFSRLLVRIYKTISLENCMELSEILSVQPIGIWSWLQARAVVEIRLFALLFCRMCRGNALECMRYEKHDY